MLEALESLKQHSKLQQFLLLDRDTTPFTQFRYSPYIHEAPSSNWSIELLPGSSRRSSCYILRQRTGTALLNPRFETLNHNYSPALQGELESCQILILPTPETIISLSLKLEQVQERLRNQTIQTTPQVIQQAKISQNKAKRLKRKKQKLQEQLQAAWAAFAQDMFATFAFVMAKQGDTAEKLQVYCSEPVIFSLSDHLRASSQALHRNSELEKALRDLHKNFDSMQFYSLRTSRYSDEYPNKDSADHSERNAKAENLQSPQSFQWGVNWSLALVLVPQKWPEMYSSKLCAYLKDESLFIDIKLGHSMGSNPNYGHQTKLATEPVNKTYPHLQQRAKNKQDLAAVRLFSALYPLLLPSDQDLPQNAGLCQFHSVASFPKFFGISGLTRLFRRSGSVRLTPEPKQAKFRLQGQFIRVRTQQADRKNAAPLKFRSPALQANSLRYQNSQHVWQQEKSLWQSLQQAAANAAQLATARQKSFYLVIEREVGHFLSYLEQFEEQIERTQPPRSKSYHSRAAIQQPLLRDAQYFWAEFFQHSKDTPFLAILLWHLWSQLESVVARKLQRKRKIARFLRKQQPEFEQLLSRLGIERQWCIRPILHYRLRAIWVGGRKIEGAAAWRKFWLNAHKNWPVSVKKAKIYYHWPDWAEKLKQPSGTSNEQLMDNIQQHIGKEASAFQRVTQLEEQLQQFQRHCQRDAYLADEVQSYQRTQSKLLWQLTLKILQPHFAALKNKITDIHVKVQHIWSVVAGALAYGFGMSKIYRNILLEVYQSVCGRMLSMARIVRQSYHLWQERAEQAKLQRLQRQTARANTKRQARQQQESRIAERRKHYAAKQEKAAALREAAQKRRRITQQLRQEAIAVCMAQKTQQLRERTATQLQYQQARQVAAKARDTERQYLRLQRQEERQLLWARWSDRCQALLAPILRLSQNWSDFYRQNRMTIAASMSAGAFVLIVILFVPKEVYGDLFSATQKTLANWREQRSQVLPEALEKQKPDQSAARQEAEKNIQINEAARTTIGTETNRQNEPRPTEQNPPKAVQIIKKQTNQEAKSPPSKQQTLDKSASPPPIPNDEVPESKQASTRETKEDSKVSKDIKMLVEPKSQEPATGNPEASRANEAGAAFEPAEPSNNETNTKESTEKPTQQLNAGATQNPKDQSSPQKKPFETEAAPETEIQKATELPPTNSSEDPPQIPQVENDPIPAKPSQTQANPDEITQAKQLLDS